jgi:HAMP domain-containing protein
MSDQDFRERVLSAVDDLKRTIDRMDDRIDRRLTTIEEDARNLRDEIGELRGGVRDEIGDLHGDIRWIRGKLEGRQEATSNKDAKTALWIALGSALAAIISLVKSFWT